MNPDDFDISAAAEAVDLENRQLRNKNLELTGALTGGGFNDMSEQNLIHEQLETDKILERIEHFLKGDQIKINEEGAYYVPPTKNILARIKEDPKTKIRYYIHEFQQVKKGTETIKEVVVRITSPATKDSEAIVIDILEVDSKRILDKLKNLTLKDVGYEYIAVIDEDKKPFNEYGVAEFMRTLSMYVTKETFLSYYDEERINEIMGDLGDALNNFLYCNYEKMGMDTKFKESKYTIIILNILHTVESCYRRALHGNEQQNLKTRAIVTQNQAGATFGGAPSMPIKKKWNPFNKNTW